MTDKKRYTINMLEGPIFSKLLLFAVPIFISNIFQQLYNTIDTAIVGHTLGTSSLAAIGSVNSVFDLMVGFALGIGNGFAIVAARCFGAKDDDLLKKSVAGSVIIGAASSVIITFAALLGLNPLLTLIKVPSQLMDEAYSYIAAITAGLAVMFCYNLCAGLLRAIGNSVVPLLFLIFSSLLNIVLDLVFITRLNMGIVGAAVATVIAQGVSAVLCIVYIFKKTKQLIPSKEHFNVGKNLFFDLLGQGYSMAFMLSIVNAGSIILQMGINSLDNEFILAGHTAARKLFMFFNMPFVALSVAVSTFVSQNVGANQYDRIKKGMLQSYAAFFVMALVISAGLFAGANNIVKLLSGSDNSTVLQNGGLYLKIVAPNYAILGVLLSTRNALQGLGKKIVPLISSIIEMLGKIVFVALFIPTYRYMAVIFCEPVIWIVMTVQLLIAFWGNEKISCRGSILWKT